MNFFKQNLVLKRRMTSTSLIAGWIVLGLHFNPSSAEAGFFEIFRQAPLKPSMMGPAIRQLEAEKKDWKAALAEYEKVGKRHCSFSTLERRIVKYPEPYFPAVMVLKKLRWEDFKQSPFIQREFPLQTFMQVLLEVESLTDREAQQVQRLRWGKAQNEGQRLRLVAQAQWILIQITKRLYDERVEYHFDQSEGFREIITRQMERCFAFKTLQRRNHMLINSADELISLYQEIESRLF
jgi:hypothetical protein